MREKERSEWLEIWESILCRLVDPENDFRRHFLPWIRSSGFLGSEPGSQFL